MLSCSIQYMTGLANHCLDLLQMRRKLRILRSHFQEIGDGFDHAQRLTQLMHKVIENRLLRHRGARGSGVSLSRRMCMSQR